MQKPLAGEFFVHLDDEPLGVDAQGAVGPGAHPELGIVQHEAVGPLHVHRLVAVGVGLRPVPGPLQEFPGVHVVQAGQLADQVGAGLAVSPFDLGSVMARVFVYDDREFPDPDPEMTFEQVKATLADFYGEIANASVKETTRGEDTIFEFQRRVGTKGAFTHTCN